jgi:hypothetical protein
VVYIYIYICKDSFPFLSGFRVLLGLGFLVLFVFFFFLGTGINVIYILTLYLLGVSLHIDNFFLIFFRIFGNCKTIYRLIVPR